MSRPLLVPKVIGHRGAKAYAPENTLASFHVAADLGIEWVELDAKISKDGEAIVFHDESLDRCTNATGLVADTDFSTLRELDAGSWFGDSFLNEKIPTLEEALEVIADRKMGVNIEIKACPGREVETAEIVLDVASRIWPDDVPPPLVSSFSHVSMETAMDMIAEWPRGLLIDEELENWQEIAEYLQIATFNLNVRNLSREQVEEFMETQKPLLGYTINSPEDAREMMRWGLDGVFSDNPDVVREAIETKH